MKNKKVIISFSGIDGSGKSTQIDLINKELNKNDNVKILHIFGKGATLHSKVEENTGIKKLINILKNQNKKIFGFRLKFYMAIFFYFLESWIFYIKIILFERKNILILDRYYYDYFVNQISQEDKESSKLMKMNKFFPKLSLSFFFDVDEQTSFHRKKEYNLDKLKKIRNNFSLCAKIINGYVVDGKKKPENITREILTKIKKL